MVRIVKVVGGPFDGSEARSDEVNFENQPIDLSQASFAAIIPEKLSVGQRFMGMSPVIVERLSNETIPRDHRPQPHYYEITAIDVDGDEERMTLNYVPIANG